MRMLTSAALCLLAIAPATAQTGPDHVLTPAPVPSVPPTSTAAGDNATTIPERVAPGGAGTDATLDSGPTNATPLSGVPSSLNSGTNRATPGGSEVGKDTLVPNLSR